MTTKCSNYDKVLYKEMLFFCAIPIPLNEFLRERSTSNVETGLNGV